MLKNLAVLPSPPHSYYQKLHIHVVSKNHLSENLMLQTILKKSEKAHLYTFVTNRNPCPRHLVYLYCLISLIFLCNYLVYFDLLNDSLPLSSPLSEMIKQKQRSLYLVLKSLQYCIYFYIILLDSCRSFMCLA